MDGFSVEFLKYFWNELSPFVLRALNYSFKLGVLPSSLRQGAIKLIPKPGKDRNLVQNWRPITLLSVIYKIISATIANRIKSVLDHLINSNQCGFIPNRYIGENVRTIYDIIVATEDLHYTRATFSD